VRAANAALSRLRHRLLACDDAVFEWRTRSRARGQAEPADLTVAQGVTAHGFTYVPTPAALIRWILRSIPLSPPRSTFIDLGSGKGRVVIAAANAGYRHVVGVEFAAELHAAARANLLRSRFSSDTVELVLGDAGRFGFPDEPMAVYLNNPFDEEVMASVIENLVASYAEQPRPIVVCYQQLARENPPHATRNIELLADVPFLTRLDRRPRSSYARFLLSPYAVAFFGSADVAGAEKDGAHTPASPP
jgi:SAM-dependent methyltransferase